MKVDIDKVLDRIAICMWIAVLGFGLVKFVAIPEIHAHEEVCKAIGMCLPGPAPALVELPATE